MWSLLTWFWKHRRQGATMVLVTVAFLCLGSSLLLVSSCLLCSLFSLGVLRLQPLFFVLRSWLFFFSFLCFFSKKQRNENLLVALFSSLYYVCSEGKGGGATGDEVGAPVLAGQCASLFLSLQSSLSRFVSVFVVLRPVLLVREGFTSGMGF